MIGALILVAAMTSQHTYTVRAGDTLSGIAQTYGETWEQVYQANTGEISNPNVIYAGQVISIPVAGEGFQGGSSPSSAEAPSPAPAPVANSQGNSGGGIPGWATCIVQRESGGNPSAVNSVPGYIGNGGGLFGDLTSTWGGYDGYAQPFDAPVSVQVAFNDQLSGNGANLAPWAADGCPGT